MSRIALIALLAPVLTIGSNSAYAGSNDDHRRREIDQKFAGGFVVFGSQTPDPASAELSALVKAPDVIRWVLEHRGRRILQGDLIVGHYTVQNWKTVKLFGKKHKIPLPPTYRGFVGWRP